MRGFHTIAASALALVATPALAEAHNEAASPEAAVTAFMTAFDAQDADAMRAMVVEGVSVTVIEEREGSDRVRAVPLATLIENIGSSPNDLEEPIYGLRWLEMGSVATVMAEYEFLIDGERSHCGTNAFNLVRVDGDWKIAGIAYSHIEDDCDVEAPQ
ncbi:hypothetical protein CD351_14900 [Erythrobacter sp. KY5]|uniref:hypothetical protein n=1 Tax=Erythrobacter sp. KY5 TaxID=2011159 RepID=UPI000DBF0F6C|nr:hypothetical protein [Erythrobacter sp. KY5]AWW75719.1 hypothetical protein CD351_14900 [Erythrobacter sp. KY5]